MKILGYIALLGGLFYVFILYAKSKIKVSGELDKLDIGGMVVGAVKGEIPKLRTFFKINIKNENVFAVSFSDLKIKLYYQGSLVAQSVEVSSKKITVLPKLDQDFTHIIEITLSKSFFDALKTLKSGQPLILQYAVSIKLFGIPIPFTYKDNFTYTK